MNNTCKNDIIAALATPYGKSAIACIRVSGKGCIESVNDFLKKPLETGELRVNEFTAKKFTEKLMAVCYKSPKSYTGEDLVELYPHGNMMICDGIIETLVERGARIAERGEFTKRAFLNGKVDLMQCEALADIIDAETTEKLVYGNKRYNGGFKSLESVEQTLKRALSTVEAVLHYGDELEENEIDEKLLGDVYGCVDGVIETLKTELDRYVGGKIVNDGFKVALIGKPNVGKSTLLNAMTGIDRAIVTPIAGTTRDLVDGEYIYNGRRFIIIDTAGIKPTDDPVEKIGIERAKKAAENADAVIKVVAENDGVIQNDPDSRSGGNEIIVVNKCDGESDVGKDYGAAERGGALAISAKKGINLTALKQKLYDLCPKDLGGLCNHRQYDCARRCLDAAEAAKSEADKADGLEIVAAELYRAYSAICELYGETADEKVIEAVFSRFCVGK